MYAASNQQLQRVVAEARQSATKWKEVEFEELHGTWHQVRSTVQCYLPAVCRHAHTVHYQASLHALFVCCAKCQPVMSVGCAQVDLNAVCGTRSRVDGLRRMSEIGSGMSASMPDHPSTVEPLNLLPVEETVIPDFDQMLGITSTELFQLKSEAHAKEVIEREWSMHRNQQGELSDEDIQNYSYVARGKGIVDTPKHMAEKIKAKKYHGCMEGEFKAADFDTGHYGYTLKHFVDHYNSRCARLTREEVLVLR